MEDYKPLTDYDTTKNDMFSNANLIGSQMSKEERSHLENNKLNIEYNARRNIRPHSLFLDSQMYIHHLQYLFNETSVSIYDLFPVEHYKGIGFILILMSCVLMLQKLLL